MINIIIAIILASMLSTVYKIAGIRKLNNDNITLVNFFTASIISIITAATGSQFSVLRYLSGSNLGEAFSGVKDLPSTALIVVLVGLVLAVVFLVTLIITAASVKANGSALSSLFKNSGFVGGVLLAVLLFHESPTILHWIGIMLTIVALVILVGDFKALKVTVPQLLLYLLIGGTCIEFGNKIYATLALAEYKNAMLAIVYTLAFLMCIPYTIYRQKKDGIKFKFSLEEIFFGAVLGGSNMFNNFFKLRSLESMDASVAFPLFASGVLLVTTLVGILIFKEKTSKRHILSVVIALISVALLNI